MTAIPDLLGWPNLWRHAETLIAEARERQQRRRRRWTIVAVCAMAGLGLAGYGLSRAAASSQSTVGRLPNVCLLIANGRVAGLLESPVASREATGTRRYHQCTWTGADLGGFMPTKRSLLIQLMPRTRAQFDVVLEKTIAAIRIHGLGEVAYSVNYGGTPVLNVYTDGLAIEVVASLVTHTLTAEEAAARALIPRLR